MTDRELRVRVLQIAADGQVYRITVDLERQPSRPLAPASLCRDDNPGVTLAVLHRLVRLDGLRASFETAVERPPEVADGDVVVFRSWWTSDQLTVARGVSRAWRRTELNPGASILHYPDGSLQVIPDHAHCRLCWKTLDEDMCGYVDGHDWLCEGCYHKFIASGFGMKIGVNGRGHR
jgi:hypothetical protein